MIFVPTAKAAFAAAILGLPVAQVFQPAPEIVKNGFKPRSAFVASPAQVRKPALLLDCLLDPPKPRIADDQPLYPAKPLCIQAM
jgi:hypothetical protein